MTKNRGVERRYSVEYVLKNYPKKTRVKYNAPLGLPPQEARDRYPTRDIKYFRPWRKYTDALVVDPPHLDIIECKIWHPESGFVDLLEYRELIPETPELEEFKHLSIRLILVAPFIRPHWERMAIKYEVNFIVWRPSWVTPLLVERGLI